MFAEEHFGREVVPAFASFEEKNHHSNKRGARMGSWIRILGRVQRLFWTYSVKTYAEYLKILKNIDLSAVTYNTKDYPLFTFEDIFQISVK